MTGIYRSLLSLLNVSLWHTRNQDISILSRAASQKGLLLMTETSGTIPWYSVAALPVKRVQYAEAETTFHASPPGEEARKWRLLKHPPLYGHEMRKR